MNANIDEPMDDWSQVWFDVGRRKGRAAALVEARADIIRKLLAARFGTISPEIESRISASSEDELDSMTLRILTATSADQVVTREPAAAVYRDGAAPQRTEAGPA